MPSLLSSIVQYPRLFQLTLVLGIGGTFQYGFQVSVLNSLSPDALGQFCFLVFLTCVVITICFCYLFLPETKGRSVLEITEDFHKFHLPWKRASGMQDHLRMESTRSTGLSE